MQKKMQSMEGQFDTYTEQAGILFVCLLKLKD